MIKQNFKAGLPRQVKIIERSAFEVAQSYQDKCQPLRTHVLAKIQSSSNPIQPSQIGYIAKRVDQNELLSKIEQNEKKQIDQPLSHRSQPIEEKYDIQPLNLADISEVVQKQSLQDESNNQIEYTIDETNDRKFKQLKKEQPESSVLARDVQPPVQVKNIFESAKIYQTYSKDEEVGPKFTKDGKIIPFSVVGKPQWYAKELKRERDQHQTSQNSQCSDQTQKNNNHVLNQLIIAKNNSTHNRGLSVIQINNSQLNENENGIEKQSKTHIYPLPWFKQEDKTFVSDIKFMKRKSKQEQLSNQGKEGRELYCEKELTEEEVKRRIRDEEDRLLQNKSRILESNKGIMKRLNLEEKMALTKEERILSKFENQERQFEQLVFKQAIDLERDPEQSVLLTGEQYRKRIETYNAFEILKPIDKKHGDTYWYKMLRNYPHEPSQQNANRKEWYPNDKNERIKEDNLEIIHKKRSLSMVVNSKNNKKKDTLNGTFLSFKSGHYVQTKLDQTSNEWNYDMIKHIQEDNYNEQKGIEAVGVNKFQQEKDSILNYSHQQKLYHLSNLPEGKQHQTEQQQQQQHNPNTLSYDRYNINNHANSSFVSANRSRINSASESNNRQITYQTKFLKKYTLNDEYQNGRYQARGSSILGGPRHDTQSQNGSFIQINSQFLDALKNNNNNNQSSQPEFEEQNILGEQVLHSEWQDRHTLAKTGKFIFKKVQLIH